MDEGNAKESTLRELIVDIENLAKRINTKGYFLSQLENESPSDTEKEGGESNGIRDELTITRRNLECALGYITEVYEQLKSKQARGGLDEST